MQLEERDDRPGRDEDADPDVWSNTAYIVDGEYLRLTWRERAADIQRLLDRATPFASLVSDLDRCPHGRHTRDDCTYCQREGHDRNQGNPWLEPGQRIGTDLGGRAIVVPDPGEQMDADAWYRDD